MPLLIFPAAFCCDPEAEADLRCGLAAVFLAGASLDFLPSIASAFPSARSWPCGDLPIALQPSSIGSKFRMMRIGCSLRTHRRIAVDAVTGSLQSDRGYHCSHGIGEKMHDDEADHGITKP